MRVFASVLTLILLAAPAAAQEKKPDEPTAEQKAAITKALRGMWEKLTREGDTASFKSTFDLDGFADYGVVGMPLPPAYLAGYKKNLKASLGPGISSMADDLAKSWKGCWFDVRNVRKEAGGRFVADMSLFDYKDENTNFASWRCTFKDGKVRWIDFMELVQGTWMKVRMTGVTTLLLAMKIKPADSWKCQALGQAGASGKWTEVKKVYQTLPAILQSHRAIIPTARMAAHQLGDKTWAELLRKRYIDTLGYDESQMYNDIFYHEMRKDLASALKVAKELRDKKRGHPLMQFRCATLQLELELYDDCLASAIETVRGAPDFRLGYVLVVSAHALKANFTAAVEAIRRCRKQFPRRRYDWSNVKRFGKLVLSDEYRKAFGEPKK